jgi:hypothetical protein
MKKWCMPVLFHFLPQKCSPPIEYNDDIMCC